MSEIRVCDKECANGNYTCCYYCKDKCDNPCELKLEECGLGSFIRMEDETKDMVNHPSHYNTKSMECKDVIKVMCEGLQGNKAYSMGAIVKYLYRFENKGKPIEDLNKAKTYIDMIIEELEGEE